MNGLELSAAAAERLRAEVPSRTVFEDAVPDGPLPLNYLLVIASEGDERALRACDVVNQQTPYLWVYSVSRNALPDVAAWEARWGAAATRRALRNWRPEGTWRVWSLASIPAGRNDTTPDTTFEAMEQFRVRSYV